MTSRYSILERIAVGGMGEVFLARQQGVGNFKRTVILKKLLPNHEEEDAVARFLDEARVSGSLSHENVVAIIEVGQPEGEQPWIALEYVHGDNASALRNKAQKQAVPVPVVVAARIVADAARGLHHAHTANDADGRPLRIVHRDVAPKNIFVRADGVSKIGDFGIAKAHAQLAHTATGAIAGTLAYMSPEQLTSQPLTSASDQFALGIVFWELLTGRRLFKGDGPVDTAEKILTGKIRAPSRYRDDVAPQVDALVLRMLQRDVDKRYQDLAAVADEIEAVLPEAVMTVGRAAVAAFVEQVAGDELRERQRRIEEGAEQTVLTPRPPGDTAIAPSSPSSSASSPSTPDSQTDATVPLRPQKQLLEEPQKKRKPLAAAAAAALIVVVLALLAVFALTPGVPTDEDRTRDYLRDCVARNPPAFREAFLTNTEAAGKDAALSALVAEKLVVLLEARLRLLDAHHALPTSARAAQALSVVEQEQKLEAQAKEALMTLSPDPTFVAEQLDLWHYDSSAPRGWLPPKSLVEIQANDRKNAINYMKVTEADRRRIVPRLIARAGLPPMTMDELLPSIRAHEALIVRFAQAPVGELPALAQQMKENQERGRLLLAKRVASPWPEVIVGAAFLYHATDESWEPTYDRAPSQRDKD